jgi:flagellar protein FlbD
VESVVAAPDTIITLTSGRKIVARSSPQEIIEAVVAYRRRILGGPDRQARPPSSETSRRAPVAAS